MQYAARALRKNPGFASIVVLLLALGIGANALVFTLVDRILLRPLPFRHPERLAAIWETTRNWDPKVFACYRDLESLALRKMPIFRPFPAVFAGPVNRLTVSVTN